MRFTLILEGHPQVFSNFGLLKSVLTRQAGTSAWNRGQHLYSRTRAVVPYLEGELYAAAYLKNVGDKNKPAWEVGYDTAAAPHAITVHETPDRVHPTRGPSTEPKQDHYLSQPRDEMSATYAKDVGNELEDAVRGIHFPTSPSRRRR